jgi:hypothetical protein
MIKQKLSLLALSVFAGVTFTSANSQAANVTVTSGDLILGFRDTVNANDFQYSLGSATLFRDGRSGLLGNIGSYLSTFDNGGTSWFNSSNLFVGAVGVKNNAANPTTAVDGDPSRTLYFTRARNSVDTQSAVPTLNIASQRGTAATNIISLYSPMAALTATTADNYGVLVSDTSAGANWSDYTVPASNFGTLGTTQQAFSVHSAVSFGGQSNVEAILDLYRMIDTTTGASPTATVGTGQFVTSLFITDTGDIYATAAVPEPSTYAMVFIALGIGAFVAFRRKKISAK